MQLGSYKHTSQEKKRYTISYTQWLDTGELVSSAVYSIGPTTVPPLIIEASAVAVDGLGITFFVSGGLDQEIYQINVLMTSDAGQRKEDTITIVVEDP